MGKETKEQYAHFVGQKGINTKKSQSFSDSFRSPFCVSTVFSISATFSGDTEKSSANIL